jgi:pimeloyl-ACP methyl ester carboxylesterase
MCPDFLPPAIAQLQTPDAIALAQSLKRQKIVTAACPRPVATCYSQQGQGGIPILLLHGFDSSLLEFFRLIPQLAANNETWAVDLLGFGFTERIEGTQYSPVTLRQHLYDVWQALIGEPIIVVGASMGGATAIDFTLTYPNAVRQLVLINSIGYSGSFPLGRFLFPPLDCLAVRWWRFLKERALAQAKGQSNPAYWDAVLASTLPLEMPGWDEAIRRFSQSGGYSFREGQFAKIDKPTLILWGERDRFFGKEDGEKFYRAIPQSVLYSFEDCGHAPQFERPDAIANHILTFQQP